MLSYALASLKSEHPQMLGENVSNVNKGYGIFGFIKDRGISIIKELENYSSSSRPEQETIDRLTEVLETNNFRAKMLVAADIWYRSNNKPKVFTPSMFTTSNVHFLHITEVSFGGKKVWDKNSLGTLLIYANYLKNNVYNVSEDNNIVYANETEDEIFYNDVDDGEDEY